MKTAKSAARKNARRNAAPSRGKCKFAVHRVVTWGDCDPAGFIYTPRVLDYACEMIDAWFREEVKVSWWQLKSKSKGVGLPTVNAVCDFISIVRPDQSLQLEMYVREIGNSSVVFEVEGMAANGRPVFRVRMVSCAIDMGKLRATRIPDWMRKKLEGYKKSCA